MNSLAALLASDPVALFVFLTVMIGIVFYLSELGPFRRFFDIVPPLVFCYFLPMLTTTLGITPVQSPLYGWFNKVFLAPILILLLLSADLRSILRLGPRAIGVMLAGSVGITAGAFLGYLIMRHEVHPEGWKNIGALAASWTGGSANMFAVKAALNIPEDVFTPIVALDPIFAYSWMGILLALASFQKGIDQRLGSDTRLRADLEKRVREYAGEKARPITTRDLLVMIAVALGGGYLCSLAGGWIHGLLKPAIAKSSALATFSSSTLGIIFATLLGLALSATPLRRLEATGASKVGYALLYLLLPTFGAQANLREFGQILSYAVIALCMMGTHAVMILLAVKLTRVPLFVGATASQANIGGPASSAVVATAYEPPLAPVGVLLGILGGALGTFAGLLCANLCRLVAP